MIPFITGVTGHRRLDGAAIPGIASNVRSELAALKQRMPSTPMVLVSALAEGADRVAADVALELGFDLWCVLPTAVEVYEKDFQTEVSLAEFRRLKSAAKRVLNASALAGRLPNATSHPQIYIDVGDEICRLSHALLAIWDGQTSGKPGGTAEVVNRFRTGGFAGATQSGLSFPDCGMVLHVPANVEEDADTHSGTRLVAPLPGEQGKPLLPGGEEKMRRLFERGTSDLDAFNRSCKRSSADAASTAGILLSADYPWRLDPVLAGWLEIYAQASATSSSAVKRRQVSLSLIVGLFVLFPLSSLLYGGLVTEIWPLFVGIGLLAAAFAIHWRHQHSNDDELWVGCRAVAEFLRVAITWRVCGLKHSIHYVIADEQIFPLDWLGMVARWIDNENRVTPAPALATDEMSAHALGKWIQGQLDYFADGTNKIGHHETRARNFGLASKVCIVLALAVYVLSIALDIALSTDGREPALQVTAWTMYGYWGLLSLSAVTAAYSGIMVHAEQEEEYSYALIKFRFAKIGLQQADENARTKLLARLGRMALREVAGWLRLHRNRPLRLFF